MKFVEHAHDMGMLLVHHSLVDCQFFGFVPSFGTFEAQDALDKVKFSSNRRKCTTKLVQNATHAF